MKTHIKSGRVLTTVVSPIFLLKTKMGSMIGKSIAIEADTVIDVR